MCKFYGLKASSVGIFHGTGTPSCARRNNLQANLMAIGD